jgi:hypothetical protein
MSSKKNAPKSVSSTKNSAVTSPAVIKGYVALAVGTRSAEVEFIHSLAKMLTTGKTSVRVAKASIKEAQKQGNAPTFRPSHVEAVTVASAILTDASADKASISEVLKLSVRMLRAYGIEDALDLATTGGYTFDQLQEDVPTVAESSAKDADADADADAPAVVKADSVDAIVADALTRFQQLGNLRDLRTADLEKMSALAKLMQTIAKQSVSVAK